MKATSVEKICDWMGVSESDLFAIAFEDATGLTRPPDNDLAEFWLKGTIPDYVKDYLTHVIFPKLVRRGHEVQV